MKFSRLAAIALLLAAPVAPAQSALEGTDHSHATLLLSTTGADVKMAAKSIARGLATNVAVLDVAAEVLWQACSDRRPLDADTQAWLAIALGKSGKARYRNVLAHCRDHASDSKVTDEAEDQLEALPADKAVPYADGGADLQSVAQQLAAAVARDAARRPAEQFTAVQFGESLAKVYARLGLPDTVEATSLRGANTRGVPTFSTSLIATYSNAGVIVFGLPRGEGVQWSVVNTAGIGAAAAADPRVAQARQWLSSPDFRLLQGLAKDLMARQEKDRGVLDQVAERIGFGRGTEDKYMADALGWLCKALAQSGDGRYKNFLLEVAETAETMRLRRHADNAADELPDTKDAPFKMGDGALAAAPPAPAPPPVAATTPAPGAAPSSAPVNPVAGAAVKLRPGVKLRARPAADAETLEATPPEVMLKTDLRNADGVWWFAEGNGARGWLRERDL